jgi:hypothetical protein
MKTMAKITAVAIFLCSVAVGASAPVRAQYFYYYPHHVYVPGPVIGYYDPGWPGYVYDPGPYNPEPDCTSSGCCPRGFSVQGGVCKPYQGPVSSGWGYHRHWW